MVKTGSDSGNEKVHNCVYLFSHLLEVYFMLGIVLSALDILFHSFSCPLNGEKFSLLGVGT